jgi:DNA ligase-1
MSTLMLLHRFQDNDKKLPNYFNKVWMSEKLDGIRIVYVPKKGFFTRTGLPITTPKYFVDDIPKTHVLDGELFGGYSTLSSVSGIARRQKITVSDWKNIQFNVFDIVDSKLPFEERYSILKKVLKGTNRKTIKLVTQYPVSTYSKANKFFNQIVKKGGEGIVIRDPTKLYEFNKRSKFVLKWKPYRTDEGVIIGYKEGKNKFKNALGSFLIEYNDQTFNLSGFKQDFRRKFKFSKGGKITKVPSSHKIGTIVTFKYMRLSNSGRPREPVYLNVRHIK